MKASSKFFLVLALMLILLTAVTVHAGEYITTAETPRESTLKWATQIGEGWQKSAGAPIFVNDSIVIISGDELLKVNPQNGEIILRAQMSQAQSYGYVAPTFAEDKIFMNLSNGTVEAFDANTFESEWVYTDELKGKGMTQVTYSENTVFTGFWNGEAKDANFVALDSTTGQLKWSMTINGGLYWAGSCFTEDAVIFATDDGSDKIAHIYSCNKETGEIISQIDVSDKGDIRSAVTYYNGRIYATTKGGYIISALLNNNVFSDVKYGEIGVASTSTPVIYKDRIYIGAGDKTISVFDSGTLDKLFAVSVTAYPQCTPLISTYYEDAEGYLYLYTTYNKTPGGVTLIRIKTDAESSEDCIVTEIYDAEGYSQYCISDIICDENGTLYYKNDSGCLFALTGKTTVYATMTEDGFLLPQKELSVSKNIAEKYGYTDTVTDGASALDVLVKIHEDMFGEDFTPDTANDYLLVSSEGYLSRVLCIDTYNFGFAINGAAPCDDVLTNYGYTGYSLNQAKVLNNDVLEFFLYRDSWAMDNYVRFELNGSKISSLKARVDENIALTLKGYSIGWYGTLEESQLESMITSIQNADITLVDSLTGETEKVTTTDENGSFSLSFECPGKYIISATEGEGAPPIIAPWFEVDVKGIAVSFNEDKTTATITSNLDEATTCWIIIAEYSQDIVTRVTVQESNLPKNFSTNTIDTSSFSGDIRIYVWSQNLEPVR